MRKQGRGPQSHDYFYTENHLKKNFKLEVTMIIFIFKKTILVPCEK